MTANKLKGNLLEYIIRQLLYSCGFNHVVPDGNYVYQQGSSGLFYVNGKGAAHDADVLMNPPIQLPFSFPTRVLFECKAYKSTIGLNIIRGAIGLRYDINEFEIVTEQSINERKNNNRATYAISNRNRYQYQVGVASVNNFSASAFEFAANNKIPLISLRWFLNDATCNLFESITEDYLNSMGRANMDHLNGMLVSKSLNITELVDLLYDDQIIGAIIRETHEWLDSTLVGLNEHGDMFFLFGGDNFNSEVFNTANHRRFFRARIHFWHTEEETWYLSLNPDRRSREESLRFYLPKRYLTEWLETNFDLGQAASIKRHFFSRIYIFGSQFSSDSIPFRIIEIDQDWLTELPN